VLPECAVVAPVLFKLFLSETVKCQCGYGAFEARSGHVPGTVGAAPASEVIAVDPDQAFVHTASPLRAFGIRARARRVGTTSIEASAEGELLPVATSNFPQSLRKAK
jgi:hypothetical protein